ncbi:MAG: glycosyltransferase [Lachnospiraceae bacterium]|nr:glycosyltransferase [Lachnospiraceae bacterium]
MKILIASDLYEPHISGIVTSVTILQDNLKKLGHDVRILTLSNPHYDEDGEHVYRLSSFDASIVYPNVRIVLPGNGKLLDELIAWKPDIIHTNCELSTFVCANSVAKKTHAPIVHTDHTVYEDYVNYFPLIGPIVKLHLPVIMRSVAARSAAMIVPTKKVTHILDRYRVKIKTVVIPSAINECFFKEHDGRSRSAIRAALGIAEDETVYVYLGRVAKEKNITELLDFACTDALPEGKILIVGDGPYRKTLERYVRKCGLTDRVIFTGMVEPKEVPGYYLAGDIFINASLSETQGLTYLEAMACGLPVLCRYDPCLDGVIVNGENGFVYETKEEFAAYAARLVNDPELRRSIGECAKKTVWEKYMPETYAKACEKLYREVIENA